MARRPVIPLSLQHVTVAGATLLMCYCRVPAPAQDLSSPVRVELVLANGRLADGQRTIRVARGDQVELIWTSDRSITVHLHGYDIELAIAPGTAEHMTFAARSTGRFPIEVHGGSGPHRTVLYVEVYPR